jgi:DNA-binding NtrC family response regulator
LDDRALTEGAPSRLLSHTWRGNVRELENTMHRAVLLAIGDHIDPEAIMLTGQGLTPEGASPTSLAASAAASATAQTDEGRSLVGRTVADVERDLIIDTLQHCLGNRTHAANILGISIRTLRNKLKAYSEESPSLVIPPATGSNSEQAAI